MVDVSDLSIDDRILGDPAKRVIMMHDQRLYDGRGPLQNLSSSRLLEEEDKDDSIGFDLTRKKQSEKMSSLSIDNDLKEFLEEEK